MESDQEKIILDIFWNFSKDFKQFKKSKTGRINDLFQSKGIVAQYVKSGTFFNKKMEGYGNKIDGKLDGFVIVRYGSSNYYIGEYKMGDKEGQGYHYFVNGLIYKGQYKKGYKVDGIVVDPVTNHILYQGDWNHDTYNGQGILTRRNGQKYEGSFVEGNFHGKGKLMWQDGTVYEGDFQQNVRQGFGRMLFPNDDVYEGEFKNNVFHGKGKYFWNEGDVFEGEFVNGKMEQGDCKYTIGVVASGMWKDSKIDYNLVYVPKSLKHVDQLQITEEVKEDEQLMGIDQFFMHVKIKSLN